MYSISGIHANWLNDEEESIYLLVGHWACSLKILVALIIILMVLFVCCIAVQLCVCVSVSEFNVCTLTFTYSSRAGQSFLERKIFLRFSLLLHVHCAKVNNDRRWICVLCWLQSFLCPNLLKFSILHFALSLAVNGQTEI